VLPGGEAVELLVDPHHQALPHPQPPGRRAGRVAGIMWRTPPRTPAPSPWCVRAADSRRPLPSRSPTTTVRPPASRCSRAVRPSSCSSTPTTRPCHTPSRLALDGLTAREHLDAGGRTVVAGFNDVHTHSVWFGQSRLDVDVVQAVAVGLGPVEMTGVEARAGDPRPGSQLRGAVADLDGPQPDRDGLDAAAAGRPVLIRHNTGHSLTVSGARPARRSVPAPHRRPGGTARTTRCGCGRR
jgi:hypothetical protein